MDISQISATGTASKSTASSGAMSSDFQTFLKMLTVQMQNQDPLNPIEASDYAVQLATFSNVEQSVKTNQLLEAMQAQFGVLSMSQLAGWVGQEARSAADVHVSGQNITLTTSPATAADRAVLVVKNAKGDTVAREDISTTAGVFSWSPKSAAGADLPTGRYSLSLESYNGETLLSTTPVEHYARILEARGGASGTRLVLTGGVEVQATEVTALRVPPAG